MTFANFGMQASIVQVGILVGVMVKVLAVMPIKEMAMQLLALVSLSRMEIFFLISLILFPSLL